jgi:hypothetical protein
MKNSTKKRKKAKLQGNRRRGLRSRMRAPAPRSGEGVIDDLVPAEIDEFRRALARRILTMLGMPRRCRVPRCRRSKRCAGADLRRQRDNPAPPVAPAEEARAKATVLRLLQRRLAQADADRAR